MANIPLCSEKELCQVGFFDLGVIAGIVSDNPASVSRLYYLSPSGEYLSSLVNHARDLQGPGAYATQVHILLTAHLRELSLLGR